MPTNPAKLFCPVYNRLAPRTAQGVKLCLFNFRRKAGGQSPQYIQNIPFAPTAHLFTLKLTGKNQTSSQVVSNRPKKREFPCFWRNFSGKSLFWEKIPQKWLLH
jgi:hypothetical protein